MTTVAFCVPAHGRLALAEVCFRQLRRTCDALMEAGVDAFGVVAADDENIEIAVASGLFVVERPNQPLGAKWNSAFEDAATLGAHLFVPLGSDDWVDPALVLAQLEQDGEQRCVRQSAIVREDGRKLARLHIPYDGGDGVRMMPRELLEKVNFRPCDDNADRAIDTTSLRNLERTLGRPLRRSYLEWGALGIVDWKTAGPQLNTYRDCLAFASGPEEDPWDVLAGVYPAEALAEMAKHYEGVPAAVFPPAAVGTPLPPRGGEVTSVRVTTENLHTLGARR